MSGSTPKYGLGYATSADAVTSLPTQEATEAAYQALLLGEKGQTRVTAPTPGTAVAVAVSFARSYASVGVTGAWVGWSHNTVILSTQTIHVWITGITATGFTLNLVSNVGQTNRPIDWRFFPRG